MSEQSGNPPVSPAFHELLARQMQVQLRAGIYATYALAQLNIADFYSDPYDEEISLETGMAPSVIRHTARTARLLCDLEQPLLPHFSLEARDTILYRVDPDTLQPAQLDSPVIVSLHPPDSPLVVLKPFSQAQADLLAQHVAEHAPFIHESPLATGNLAGQRSL